MEPDDKSCIKPGKMRLKNGKTWNRFCLNRCLYSVQEIVQILNEKWLISTWLCARGGFHCIIYQRIQINSNQFSYKYIFVLHWSRKVFVSGIRFLFLFLFILTQACMSRKKMFWYGYRLTLDTHIFNFECYSHLLNTFSWVF